MNNPHINKPIRKEDLSRMFAVNTTSFLIRYAYPEDVGELLDQLPAKHRNKSGCDGKIWINGKRLYRRRAMLWRPFFTDPFGWGCSDENAKFTSLEICLKLFHNESHAVKLYIPFMHTFVEHWYGYSGYVEIDITDFLLDNYYRLSGNLVSYYYTDARRSIHEVEIWRLSDGSFSSVVEGKEMTGVTIDEIKEKISLKLARHILHQ